MKKYLFFSFSSLFLLFAQDCLGMMRSGLPTGGTEPRTETESRSGGIPRTLEEVRALITSDKDIPSTLRDLTLEQKAVIKGHLKILGGYSLKGKGTDPVFDHQNFTVCLEETTPEDFKAYVRRVRMLEMVETDQDELKRDSRLEHTGVCITSELHAYVPGPSDITSKLNNFMDLLLPSLKHEHPQ